MKKQKLKIVAVSDTHGKNDQMEKLVSEGIEGDFFIHAGDFTWYNKRDQFNQFIDILSKLKFRHKIVIPGNHEILLDPSFTDQDRKQLGFGHVHPQMTRQKQLQKLKQHCIFVQHEELQIEGIKFFCSSYSSIPFYYRTAYQISQHEMEQAWNGVPQNIDILITHAPPYKILDKTCEQLEDPHVGQKVIKKYIEKTTAKLHIFGHIHQAKGILHDQKMSFFNVAQKVHFLDFQL